MTTDDDIVDGHIVEDAPHTWPLYDAAIHYLASGWTPTPLRGKRPTQKHWVGLKPSPADCWAWWVEDAHDGIGIICGTTSGNLLVVDIEHDLAADTAAMETVVLDAIRRGVIDHLAHALDRTSASTPSGGLHLYFTVTDTETVPGNEKLAYRGAGDTAILLAETRGEGGQVAAPPGDRRAWRGTSRPGVATPVTRAQLAAVLDSFRTLDQAHIRHAPPPGPRIPWDPDRRRRPTVADAWTAPLMDGRITWADICDHGWTRNGYDDEGRSLWVRPDYGHKTRALSSARGFETWAGGPAPVLVVHSTAVPHLPAGGGQRLTPSRVWAASHFDGDEAAANAALEALATTGDIDPRIGQPVPTCVLDEVRRIVTLRAAWQATHATGPTAGATADGPSLEDAVFGHSPQLGHIRQAARHRLVSPWAVLASVLATIIAETPPHHTLPATIGARISLNIAMGIVGASGLGKTAAHSCARDLLHIDHPLAQHIGPGTGEGLIQVFLAWDPERKRNVLAEHPQALLYADEVGQIDSVQNRAGATFGPTIRSMWSGSEVSTTNADQTRKRHLRGGSYRLAIIAGIQPTKAGILLDDAGSGTPQRWLWLPAADPGMPDEAPDWPGQLTWRIPAGRCGLLDGNVTIGLPDEITVFVREQHRARQRSGGVDGLDGHLILTRLKVAAALALLHGRTDIDMPLWDVAGLVMEMSLATRGQCADAVARQRASERRALGAGDVAREQGAREARIECATRWARLLWRTVDAGAGKGHANSKHRPGEGCTRRCLTFALRNHRDADVDAATARGADLDWIREVDGRWRPGGSQPAEGD